jgi:enoyl-CoA hydratase/carnithine racemase
MARLPRLVGRGRALEILLVADDLDGPRAEQYGYVNRLIGDGQLDDEVEAIASRLARFDHDAKPWRRSGSSPSGRRSMMSTSRKP